MKQPARFCGNDDRRIWTVHGDAALPVGTYAVEVTAVGFPVTTFPGVVIRITETTT